MYKAKAEAVSGSNVYAGGKWLKCIGNKPVRVGENVWTDGKVVYGYHKESQQPLVITAPQDDEGIPIMIRDEKTIRLFTFKKGSLQFIQEMPALSYKDPTYHYPRYRYHNPIMINDYKSSILYNKKAIAFDEENKYVEARVIAANINRQGDFFSIIKKNSVVEIRKNGVAIQTFDLNAEYINEIVNQCPDPPSLPFLPARIASLTFELNGFIEDENNWWFSWDGFISKFLSDEYTGSYPESGLDPTPCIGLGNSYYLSKYFVYTNKDKYLIYKAYREETFADDYLRHEDDDPRLTSIDTVSAPDVEKINFQLQDGYYYKLTPVIVPDETNPISMQVYWIDIFSPSGEKIIDGKENDHMMTIASKPVFLITKIKNGEYLLAWIDNPSESASIFTITDGKKTSLIEDKYCANQRLRPMKKIKNWQNRIEEIAFDD